MNSRQAMLMAVVIVLFLAGCISAANRKASAIHQDSVLEDEGPWIVAMKYAFPATHGVIYLASEQFLLCRRKDLCPIEGRFTLSPEPSSEQEGASPEPARKKLEIPIKAVVYFTSGSAQLEVEAVQALNELLTGVKGLDPSGFRVVIAGYTDSTGTSGVNTRLAIDRARTVAFYLRKNGITAREVVAGGRPLCCYIAPNDTVDGRAKNRRAEIWVEPIGDAKDEKPN
jgi:outer membrane protein OmpA-like peptidoglycan-associated protein